MRSSQRSAKALNDHARSLVPEHAQRIVLGALETLEQLEAAYKGLRRIGTDSSQARKAVAALRNLLYGGPTFPNPDDDDPMPSSVPLTQWEGLRSMRGRCSGSDDVALYPEPIPVENVLGLVDRTKTLVVGGDPVLFAKRIAEGVASAQYGGTVVYFAPTICAQLDRTIVEERDGNWLSALAFVVERVSIAADTYNPVATASLPRLHRIGKDDVATLPSAAVFEVGQQPNLPLPGLSESTGAPSWLIHLFDQAYPQRRGARGGRYALRLWIGAVLHLRIRDRTGHARDLCLGVDDVASWLYPGKWATRRRDWPRFIEALKQLATLTINTPAGPIALVAVQGYPPGWRRPDGKHYEVLFTLRVPACAATGARVNWPALVRYGAKSEAHYRGYLVVCAHQDRSAVNGRPLKRLVGKSIRGPDGLPRRRGKQLLRSTVEHEKNPATHRNAPLDLGDFRRWIGYEATRANLHRARAVLDEYVKDNLIELEDVGQGRTFRIWGVPDNARPRLPRVEG